MSDAAKRIRELREKTDKLVEELAKKVEFNFLMEGKDSIPERIRRRTRLGKGVTKSGDLQTLKKLDPKYIKWRKNQSLPPETKPSKSNLTLTGSMLNNIKGKRSGTKLIFYFVGSTRGVENEKKAKYARELGRNFFALSKTEKNGILTKIRSIISRAIRKL
jgi:mRNA-degrading endonuclease RelE of RelBE toxin-antitoxin system